MDHPGSQAQILLVDDHEENLVAMREVLEPLGERVVTARSGADALRALLRGEFATILLDVQMPGMDGFETAALIRSRERTRHVPILFVTALMNDGHFIAQGYSAGAVDYLTKPVDPLVLRSKVSVFVELWKRGKALERRGRELERARHSEEESRLAAEFEQQLVGIVSHDIRSPLSAVKATAAALLADATRDSSQERALKRIVRGASRIEQLTNLLLDFTRVRIGGGLSVSPQPTDLRELCRAVADESQAGHAGRRVELSFDDGDGVGMWDPARLQQVLANLLDNAFKYGAPGQPVRVNARLYPEAVKVEVHNDGEPIRPELMPVLFEPFSRGRQTEATIKVSLGLGLYIVREIARAHGGEVTVRSAREGTTFTVALPRFATVEREAAASSVAR